MDEIHIQLTVQSSTDAVFSMLGDLLDLIIERGDRLVGTSEGIFSGEGTLEIVVNAESEAEARAVIDSWIDQIPGCDSVLTEVITH
jgi:hypothetical protein